MDIEVTNSPELSVGEPQSVPSRISVVLVKEAKAGGTPRLGCPHVDQNLRLLAGVAKPASVTVCEDSHGSPYVLGGSLSSSDLAGRLLPVVPAWIPFPVGPVEPAGPDGPYVAGGPVGPYGTLSPFISNHAGPDGPYVAGGSVGPHGTLSPFISNPDGPDGPYVAGGPVGPYGILSLFDFEPAGYVGPYVVGGPVGPDGTLSPFISDPAGPDGPYVAGGPVGPHGMLSPFISDPAGPDGPYIAGGPVGPYGTLSPSDSEPVGSVGPYVAGGPVGPDGMLSPFISDPAGPDGPYVAGDPVAPYGTFVPSGSGSAILVDPGGVFPFSDPPPGGTLLPGEEGPGLGPSVPTDDLVSVAAVPLPAGRDPIVARSPVEGLVCDCDDVTEENIAVHGGWSDPDFVGTPVMVAMVGMDALPMRNAAPLDCADGGTAWIADNGYRCETIDGMTVYYGSDLCDSDELDWDDPYDIASEEYVDQYNSDMPEGMDRMVFEGGRGPYGSDMLVWHMCVRQL